MISFLIWFLVLIVVIAIVIIGIKWLMGVAGIAIPPPLMYILGLILFLVLLLVLLNYSGAWSLGSGPGFYITK